MVMPRAPRAILATTMLIDGALALSFVQTRAHKDVASFASLSKSELERGDVVLGNHENMQEEETFPFDWLFGRRPAGTSSLDANGTLKDTEETDAFSKEDSEDDPTESVDYLLSYPEAFDTELQEEHQGGMRDEIFKPKKGNSGPKDAWNDYGIYPDLTDVPVFSSDTGTDFVGWSLCNVSVHSNLAGVGPDSGEESIRYHNIVTVGGQPLDLVVTANSSYIAKDININGLVSDDSCFGVVNLKSRKQAGYNDVDLLFSIYLSGTNTSAVMDKFYFTVVDFDIGVTATEHATFYNRVSEIFYVPDHEMIITGNLSTIGLTFSSTMPGNGMDNPKDPSNLTALQKRRAVMVTYLNKTQWRINLAVEGGQRGRNFAFAGYSNLIQDTTTTTTLALKTTTDDASGGGEATPAPTPAPRTTTSTTTCYLQSCQVWADPHVSGFDNSENQGPAYLMLIDTSGAEVVVGSHDNKLGTHTFDGRPIDVDAFDTGDFWLVKSEPVHVQARFRRSGEFIPDRAAVGAVAVGGPFLGGHKLIVEPLDGQVTFDGVPLPNGVWCDNQSEVTVRQDGPYLNAFFPMSVSLSFRRLPKHIDVKITMPLVEGGLDGECGNFDGIAENDEEMLIEQRMGDLRVDSNMLLFDKVSNVADMSTSNFLLVSQANNVIDMNATSFTEEDYQAVAALRRDDAMVAFVKRILELENKFVPPEQESELEGFVQWFSGTKAIQSLEQMQAELHEKEWVHDVLAAEFTSESASLGDPNERATPEVPPAADDPADDLEMVEAFSAPDNFTCAHCLVWGPSQILSFRAFEKHRIRHPKNEASFRTEDWWNTQQSVTFEGSTWLVKTTNMHMQGRFWRDPSGIIHLGALAVGGPFLAGNTVIIYRNRVTWNDQEILGASPTGFTNFTNEFVWAESTSKSELVSNGKTGQGEEFTFHNGLSVTVNRRALGLAVKIHMCEAIDEADGIEGQCGSFPGSPHDTARNQAIMKLQKSEVMFPDRLPAQK